MVIGYYKQCGIKLPFEAQDCADLLKLSELKNPAAETAGSSTYPTVLLI